MSNLYYAYRGDNAGQRSTAAPPQHPATSNDSLQLQQGVPLRSPTQPSISFSNHQAWAPDQPTTLQTHPPQPSPPSVNTSFQTSPSRVQHSLPMNATRPPLASRQSQYDDNLFQIMGKPFSDTASRHQLASSPPTDQYAPLRSSQASNVFDPSEFPSLGGAIQNSVSVQQPLAPQSLLSSSNPIDSTGLANVGISASGINGLGHYADLYSMGPYGDGRGKAVDALTGTSASAEFNMQSEDFPALGGGPGVARATNGTAPLPGASSSVLQTSSIGKLPVTDGLYDRQVPGAASTQAALLGLGHTPTSMLIGRSQHLANGYQSGESPSGSSVLSVDRGNHHTSLHQPRYVDEILTSASPSRAPFPPPSQVRGKTQQLESPRRGNDVDAQMRRDITRTRQIPMSNTSNILGNGENSLARVSLQNGPAAKVLVGTPMLSRPGGHRHDNSKATTVGSLSGNDKYGMKALLPIVLPMSEGNGKAENVLAVGLDLTALGLNLNSSQPLHKTFDNPWDGGQGGTNAGDNSESSPKNQEPEYKLPTCYYMQPPALRSSHFTKFQLETLFYIFYNMPRDVLQLLAAVELYSRKWHYHKGLKLWFTCDIEANGSYDNGGYIYFDLKSWERRQFHEANQSFIQGLMTEEELNSVKIPPL